MFIKWWHASIWIIAFCSLGQAQSCLPQGIVFDSQAKIDAFASDHPDCTEILGGVIIDDALPGNISNLEGLHPLRAIGQFLEINDNAALQDLQGLRHLERIGEKLNITFNNQLQDLDGLETVHSVGTSIRIASNQKLEDIRALSALSVVNSDLSLSDNAVLPHLKGLDSVLSIGGNLLIKDNKALRNLQGLESLQSIGRVFELNNNDGLMGVRSLVSLQHIGKDCIIDDNDALAGFQGLDSLRSIGGFLQIVNNASVINFAGLERLASIKGLLLILNNASLVSLAGIDNIDPSTIDNMSLSSSFNLVNCSVKSICQYLMTTRSKASIADNGDGCNTRHQILVDCPLMGPGQSGRPNQNIGISVFPNPTFGRTTVRGEILTDAAIRIFDAAGKLVLTGNAQGFTIDTSTLPAGFYLLEAKGRDNTFTTPFLKISF